MEETDFCSLELSKLLVDLGFDWDSEYSWYTHSWMTSSKLTTTREAELESFSYDGTDIIPAPTLWDAQKWFREVKKIDILVCNCACGYLWEISKAGDGTGIWLFDDQGDDPDSGCWRTYEGALEAGLKMACLKK